VGAAAHDLRTFRIPKTRHVGSPTVQVDAFKGRIARLAADLGRNRLPQLPEGAPPEAVLQVGVSNWQHLHVEADSCALLTVHLNLIPSPSRHRRQSPSIGSPTHLSCAAARAQQRGYGTALVQTGSILVCEQDICSARR